MKKTLSRLIIYTLVFNLIFMLFIPITIADSTTTIQIEPENISVTIGDSFILYINTTIDGEYPVGSYEIDPFNFTSGIVNVTAVNEGNFHDGYTSWWNSGFTIDNASGVVEDVYAVMMGDDTVTGDKNIIYLNMLAYGVGVSPVNFTGVLALGEDPYDFSPTYGNITVHPEYVSGSTATTESYNSINLSWSTPFGSGVDKCVVFANSSGTAAGKKPVDEIYNGTGSYYLHTGLSPEQEWNYSFWGWNETESMFSLLFQQESNTTDSSPLSGTWIVLGDPTPANNTVNIPYTTSYGVSIPIVAGALTDTSNEAVVKGIAGGTDSFSHQYLCQLLNVTQGATEYTETVDYIVDSYDGTIDWSPGGSEPAPGTTYYVNYTYIYDTDSSFTYWINTTSNDKTESSVSSGTKSLTMTGLTGGKEWWNVTAIYETNKTQGNYTFTINNKPSGGGGGGSWEPDPPNGAPSVVISTALSVNVDDPDGDNVNVTFYWRNNTRIDNDTVAGSGIASVNPSTLNYDTEYSWYVIANDSIDETRGPDTGYWTFNTSTLGITLTKEWCLNAENNTIRSWINVTNTGSTNFTNVNVWDIEQSDLHIVSYNHSDDFSGNGHWNWEIPFLNITGYENNWYNITMLHELYTDPAPDNGTEFWNRANISHLGLTAEENVSGYSIGFTATKEANISAMNSTALKTTWWINITNSGDFNLTNVTVNETYFSCINYTSSNLEPEDESDNETFIIPYIKPSESFSLIINVTATADCIENGTRIYNNVTIRSDQLDEQTFSEYLTYGGMTERLRITYETTLTNVADYGDNVFAILSILLVIGSILVIVGLLYKFGYIGSGEQ